MSLFNIYAANVVQQAIIVYYHVKTYMNRSLLKMPVIAINIFTTSQSLSNSLLA